MEVGTGAGRAAELRREVRAFLAQARAEGRFVPRADAWLASHSPEFSRELGRRGWLGLNWPARYGGADRPELERYVITEELLAAGAPVAAHWIAQRQSGPLLLRYGTEQQRLRFMPAIARGECYFAICMSEPGSGSDLASVQTKAVKVEGGWRLSGRKVWTSHAHRSHYGVLLCRTAPLGERRHEGLSQLIVDLRGPGITISPIRLLTGESDFSEVLLEDAFVPDEMLVGALGDGWKQVTSELALERSGPERFFSTLPLVLALVERAGATTEGSELLGRLSAHLWTLRRMSLEIVRALQAGEGPAMQAALVKDLGTRFEQELVETVRIFLGEEPDLRADDPLVSLLAWSIAAAPTFTLRGGTTEILRGIVARDLERA